MGDPWGRRGMGELGDDRRGMPRRAVMQGSLVNVRAGDSDGEHVGEDHKEYEQVVIPILHQCRDVLPECPGTCGA